MDRQTMGRTGMMRYRGAGIAMGALILLSACNMRQDQAGPGGNEAKVSNSAALEPVDQTPLSSTPGAAPDNSQIEPRDPVTR